MNMKISYKNTEDELLEYSQLKIDEALTFSKFHILAKVFIGFLIFALILYLPVLLIRPQSFDFAMIAPMLFVVVFIIPHFFALCVYPIFFEIYKRNLIPLLKTAEVQFEDKEVHIATETSESAIQWKAFIKYSKTTRYVFLYINPKMAYIVPRRVFVSDTQWQEFVELVKKHVKTEEKIATEIFAKVKLSWKLLLGVYVALIILFAVLF